MCVSPITYNQPIKEGYPCHIVIIHHPGASCQWQSSITTRLSTFALQNICNHSQLKRGIHAMHHRPTVPATVARSGTDFIASHAASITGCTPLAVNTDSVQSVQPVNQGLRLFKPLKLSHGCEEEKPTSEYRYSRSRRETSREKNFQQKLDEC